MFRQIKLGQQTIFHYACHGEKIWICIFLSKPIIMLLVKTNMGLGKRSPKYWVFIV